MAANEDNIGQRRCSADAVYLPEMSQDALIATYLNIFCLVELFHSTVRPRAGCPMKYPLM